MSSSIRARHSRRCPVHAAPHHARCKCKPSFRAAVYDKRAHKWLTRTFASRAAAKSWRADTLSALGKGVDVQPSTRTLREVCETFLEGAEASTIHSLRTKAAYKPATLRGYRHDLETYVLPEFGAWRLSDLRRRDFRALKERLLAQGLSGQSIRNVFVPLQAVLRRAVEDEEIAVSPLTGFALPEPSGRRERSVAPEEVDCLLNALDDGTRALYATVYLSGLRRGEARALRWEAVDFRAGVIEVRKSWDDVAGEISPKSKAGSRRVPMGAELRRVLIAHKLATGRDGRDFVYGSKRDRPFIPTVVRRRAITAWNAANVAECERAKKEQREPRLLVGVGLHELRHGYVSWMFDAGFSLERIGDYIGHSSAAMTNAYRHLLEGHEAEAAAKQDEYLAQRATRTAQAEA